MTTQTISTVLFALLTCTCLFGAFCTAAVYYISTYSRKRIGTALQLDPPLFWTAHRRLCGDGSMSSFLFCLACARYVYTLLFALAYAATLLGTMPVSELLGGEGFASWAHGLLTTGFLLSLVTITIVAIDIIPRTWGFLSPETLFRFVKWPSWLFLTLLFPLTVVVCRLVRLVLPQTALAPFSDPNAQLAELFGST